MSVTFRLLVSLFLRLTFSVSYVLLFKSMWFSVVFPLMYPICYELSWLGVLWAFCMYVFVSRNYSSVVAFVLCIIAISYFQRWCYFCGYYISFAGYPSFVTYSSFHHWILVTDTVSLLILPWCCMKEYHSYSYVSASYILPSSL